MTDKERMQELIEFYIDGDARHRVAESELAAHAPKIGDVLDIIMGHPA